METGPVERCSLYDKEDWAKQFDVVVHNECFADAKDEPYVQRITQAHQAGVPAVVIHCAMHTYRAVHSMTGANF